MIEVESVLSPDGEPKVALTDPRPVGRVIKHYPEPVYLTRQEARQLAHQMLEAAGYQYAAILDEELDHLQKEAEATTSVAEYERLVLLKSMVQMMRRMFPETVS
jgi:hypothetical protein